MDDADDLDPIRDRAVEDRIATHRKVTQFRRQFGSGSTHESKVRKPPERGVDPIQQLVGGGYVVRGDMKPDLQKVVFGERCAQADGQLMLFQPDRWEASASRRRPWRLMSSIAPDLPGPLARPSFQSRKMTSSSSATPR